MTTTNQGSQPSTTGTEDIDVLAAQLDGTNRQRAEAIAAFVDGRIDRAINGLRQEVTQLVTTQRGIREQAQSLPEEQRREVQPEVDAASRQTDEARQATNDLQARRDAGEEVSEEEVTRVRQQSDEAAAAQQRATERVESVSQTDADQQSVDRRLTAVRSVREESERQQTPPAPRRPQDSTNGDVFGRLDNLERTVGNHGRRLDDHDTVIAHVFSEARAAYFAGSSLRKAGTIALATFVVTFLIYCLLWLLTDMGWQWDNALGIPAILAGIAGAIVFAFSDDGVSYESYSTAHREALVSRDQRDAEEHRRQQRNRSSRREVSHDESDSSETRTVATGRH